MRVIQRIPTRPVIDMINRCIFQFIWIRRVAAGLYRIPNDPFDNTFGSSIDRTSPSIWDSDRQSFIHNAIPVPVHSHNDYWRRIPLFEALGSGCISVEADVHLHDSDLLVGHTSMSLHAGSTLRSMYLEPLQRMLEAQNAHVTDGTWRGIFNLDPQQTIVLLIDHKTAGPETFAELYTQLQPLRDLDYLTYWNGTERVIRPLTVVATGNAPFASVTALNATHRDIFWDAQLDVLVGIDDSSDANNARYTYNISNSYFASTKFQNAILWPYRDRPSQIQEAKARGLIARYWNTPAEPQNLREIVLRVLVERDVGILNMDDMGIVRARARGLGKIKS